MKAIFVGVKRPYTSPKNHKTYYGAHFVQPDAEDPECVEVLSVDSSPKLHAQLVAVDIGTELDIDVTVRMFAGKPQGLTLVGING